MTPISPNTQATLLLTAPLIAGRNETAIDLLSPGEFNRIGRILRESQREPADLLGADAGEILERCRFVFDQARLQSLLGRGFLLSQAVERWTARSIWVVSRTDEEYPRRLNARLKDDAPPILYGCGAADLLETGGFAVVGSRHVDAELLEYTDRIGRLAAEAGRTLVSGGARGIDQAAMRGALAAGGRTIGVLADDLERAAVTSEHREALMDRKLTLVSPYDPAAGFNVGHAMQRNKVIYGFADAALVVSADHEKGGTWAGAIEQLEKLRLVPVFVRTRGDVGRGNLTLVKKGGLPWPEPKEAREFSEILAKAACQPGEISTQDELPMALQEHPKPTEERVTRSDFHSPPSSSTPPSASTTPAESLFNFVRQLLSTHLDAPLTEAEIATKLGVTKPQAKDWLKRLLADGDIEKLTKPTRYRAIKSGTRLL